MSLFDSYDEDRAAILNPQNVYQPIKGFPETVLITFRRAIMEIAREKYSCRLIRSLNGGERREILSFSYREKELAICRSPMGAPMAVALMEELIAMGGKNFIFFGSCGTLDRTLPPGGLLVPEEAYRDEGTSYHYMAAKAGDYVPVETADETKRILQRLHVPFSGIRLWTTDGLYRETKKNMELRRREGCRAVDMECSAIMAAARFRQIKAYYFLYAEDNLDGSCWDPRIMGQVPASASEMYLQIAAEIGAEIS